MCHSPSSRTTTNSNMPVRASAVRASFERRHATRANAISERTKRIDCIESHRAGPEDAPVGGVPTETGRVGLRNGAVRVGAVVLNRNAPFPPAPGNVDEVRVGGEEPAEGVHIVPIPCFSEARYYTSNSGRIRWPLGVTWSDPRQCQNETYRHNALHVSPPISARRRTYGRLTDCA